jgi:hypothetical protein
VDKTERKTRREILTARFRAQCVRLLGYAGDEGFAAFATDVLARALYGADPYSADVQRFRADVAEERATAPTASTAPAPTNGATVHS